MQNLFIQALYLPNMKNKHVGFLIIGITILFFFVVMSFNNALETIVNTTCTHGAACPMHITLKTQKAISYGLMGLIAIVGVVISFFLKDEEVRKQHKKSFDKEEKKKRLENLDEAEREVMNIILREEGSVFQSDIVKETKKSKVKVTRVLDRLEGKHLIERKRRGMANVVILR